MNKLIPAFQLLGIGFYIGGCIAGGIALGWWLGGKRPLFVIFGLVIGLILAFYGTYNMIRPLLKKANEQSKDKEND
jgi:hypothetical protein